MTDAEPENVIDEAEPEPENVIDEPVPSTETEYPSTADEPIAPTDVPVSTKDKIIGILVGVFVLLVIGFFAYVEISDFIRYSRNEVPRWHISSSYRRYATNQVLLNAAKTGDQNVIDAVRTGLYNGRIP